MSRRPEPNSPARKSGRPLPPADWPGGLRVPSRDVRKNEPARSKRGKLTAQEGWSLLLLLVLPSLALTRATHSIAPWLVVAWAAGISLATWFAMAFDKRLAVTGQWRTPESTLHALELLGGWPASFLAQRIHRHKIVKTPYQITFWCIVAIHQLTAADFLLGWKSLTLLRGWLGV